jgi:ABC-2 type transport system ATP-binding protein
MTTTMAPPAIAATGLRKSYREHLVLDGLDLRVPEGTILALLGRSPARSASRPHSRGPATSRPR